MTSKASLVSVRLLGELLLIIAVAYLLAETAVDILAEGVDTWTARLLAALLMLLIGAPPIYWRSATATRRVAVLSRLRSQQGPISTQGVRTAIAYTWIAQAVALALTVAGAIWQHRAAEKHAHWQFDRIAERLVDETRLRFDDPLHGLRGARGLYAGSQSIDRDEFRRYVESREIDRNFPGIRGLGLIERVQRSALATFIARERADAAPEFTVRTEGEHDELYVIKYIEPLADNRPAWGYDVGQERHRREAIERAIDSGGPALSGRVALEQDQRKGAGFLLYLPVYRDDVRPQTTAQRRAALWGVFHAPIVVAELMAGVGQELLADATLELFDAPSDDPDQVLFDSAGFSGPAVKATPHYSAVRSFEVGGRILTVRVGSTPVFEAAIPRAPTVLILVGGAAASVLLALTVWLLASGRVRAQNRAHQMTAELDRLARVAQHTSNAVMITDAALRINWVNNGFERITGFAADEAIGRPLADVLCDPTDIAAGQMRAAISKGNACRLEQMRRGKDGRTYWVDIDLQPVRSATGVLTGWMEIATEITAQKRTSEQLEAALRHTEAWLRTIDTLAIVSVTDCTGRIIDVNEAFCRISGFTRDELIGHDHAIVNSAHHDAAFWHEMWSSIGQGLPWRGQIRNRARDGRLYWVDSMIAPFASADGRVEKYVSIRTDITESKLAEEALARERQRLDHILEGTHVGTWEWNIETGETVFNERWAQMIGYTLDELQPVSIETWGRFLHPDDVSRSSVELERHFNLQTPHYECELRMRHRDGHWIWVLDRGKVFLRADNDRPRLMAGTHMDISQRKAAEAALRANQAFLDRISRVARVGGWELDIDTDAVRWSDECCRLHGVEPGHVPDLDEALGYFLHDSRQQMQQAIGRARETGQGWDLELSMITAEGRRLWVRSLGQVEFDGKTRVRVSGALLDVTTRHELQDELHRKNTVLANVLENLPCGLSVYDNRQRLVASNRQYRTLLDFPDWLFDRPEVYFDDFVRFNIERGEYRSDSDTEALVRGIVDATRQASTVHQFERIRPDGLPLEIRAAAMPEGGFVTTYTDISERRRAEAEIQRSAELLRGAIDAVDEAFVVYDADDRLVLCNEKYRHLFANRAESIQPGLTFAEVIRIGALDGRYPDAVGRVEEFIAHRLAWHRAASGTVVQTLDDGRIMRVIDRRMPDGHTVGFRIDITDLEHARRAAEEGSQAKSRFLANMSHEIRTPMNAILGMLRLLQRTKLSTRQSDYAIKAQGAAHSLLGLLNDILDFSKIEADKLSLDPRECHAEVLFRDLGVILSSSVGDKPVEVVFDIDPGLPPVLVADDMRLRQVLINLGGNAIKFTERGEVVLTVRCLESDEVDALIEFSVRDTGIGIAREHQSRIFDSFSQAESSTTRRFGGTGLGVAISHRLVAMMGGRLDLQSTVGVGTTFTFCIRLGIGESTTQSPTRLPTELRCLLVDGHDTTRAVMGRVCDALGWATDRATDGRQAFDLAGAASAAQHPYDVVILDCGLDEPDTRQVAAALRASPALNPSAVIVTMTTPDCPCLAGNGENDPLIDNQVTKPLTAAMLVEAIADARLGRDGTAHLREQGAAPQPHRLGGLRILVVEDNPNNRQIAMELLTDEGAEVLLANDGRQGVERALAEPMPDLVLMDLQMPVMDGLTAAGEIRKRLDNRQLPIIAMTANAMPSDREACLAVGMNDHVGKPFELDVLVATIRKCARRAAAEPAVRSLPALPAPVRARSAQPELIDIDGALARMGGRRGTYARALQSFRAEIGTTPARLAELLASGDREGAERLLHTFKGLADTLGVRALAAAAARIEKAIRGTDTSSSDDETLVGPWREAVESHREALDETCRSMADAPRPSPPDHETSVDTPALRALLAELSRLLRQSDMRAVELCESIEASLGDAWSDRFAAVQAAIGQLEFEQAGALCEAWSGMLGPEHGDEGST